MWFNFFSCRYMAGRVSRAPGEDEGHLSLQQALADIKGNEATCAPDAA
jgi:hypothetical protein